VVVPPEETYEPSFLPDGRHFLYQIGRTFEANRTTFAATLDGKMKRRLLSGTRGTVYAPPAAGEKGHLLFLHTSGALMAQPFDEKRLESTGEAFQVAESVASLSASANGVLAYSTLESLFNRTQLVWFDRTGKPLAKVGPPGQYNGVALSPDGSRVAVARQDDSGNPDIWIWDVNRDGATRFTFDASTDWEPVWSSDSKRLAFASRRDRGIDQIYWKDSSGAGNEEAIWNSAEGQRLEAWSPDGKFLLFMHQNDKSAAHKPLDDNGGSKYARRGAQRGAVFHLALRRNPRTILPGPNSCSPLGRVYIERDGEESSLRAVIPDRRGEIPNLGERRGAAALEQGWQGTLLSFAGAQADGG
jgi:dipeptidyl aminopeptidase/acylaminoacyl peptidase